MEKTTLKVFVVAVMFLTLTTFVTGAVDAAEVKGKFPSMNITLIVPVTPGGGFDTNARLIAPFLKKHLPGQPNVVIKNVPGGEWRIGIMEMYKSKPDGHTVCLFNLPGNLLGQITHLAEYDLNKVSWIGTITDSVYVCAFSPRSGLKTLQDLRKAPQIKAGVVGLTSTTSLGIIISAKEMGFKVRLINHNGSQEAILSAIRGDVDMVTYVFPTMRKFLVDAKDLVPFTVYAKQRIKELPDVPTIGELGFGDMLKVINIDYMLGAPPGTPENVMNVWRNAFDRAVADQEFQKIMREQLRHAPGPLNGKLSAQKVNDYLGVYSQYKELIMQYTPK